MTIEELKQSVQGQFVAVVGVGVSNVPLIRFLSENGAKVIAHDKRTADQLGDTYTELSGMSVQFVLGDAYLDEITAEAKLIFKTPGIRVDVPALKRAEENGARITSEMELFFELCPAKIIAVTGSDGKTTTTSLIHDMLCREGCRCYLGGNIGRPLIEDLEQITPKDKVVVELSSFQLHTMKKSPSVAVVTNVTPNHLDWHTDFEEYVDAKRAVFHYQKSDDRAVFNYDNEITRAFGAETNHTVYFSSQHRLENGYFLDDGEIVFAQAGKVVRRVLKASDIYIPGMHNVENFMAAIAAVEGMVSDETVRETAREFKGVPHRIEFVRELDGVRYYNDSIASSPARTTAGLQSFDQKVILIAGGYDKKIPFDDFGPVVNQYVKKLVLCGLTSGKIEAAVRAAANFQGLPIFCCDVFADAVSKARAEAEEGDIVVLSPACASFDLFKNFEERGNCFKDLVNQF